MERVTTLITFMLVICQSLLVICQSSHIIEPQATQTENLNTQHKHCDKDDKDCKPQVSENKYSKDININNNVEEGEVPPGHMKKLGEHKEPLVGEILELDYMIGGKDFYEHFAKKRRPVVFRGVSNSWMATKQWKNESYLREMYSDVLFDVEDHIIYNNDLNTRITMNFSQFLDEYKNKKYYLDSPFPQSPMMNDVEVPLMLRCEGQAFSSSHLLFSNGGTSGPLHVDGYENFLAVFSGIKVVYTYAPEYLKHLYMDQYHSFPGLSPVNPEAVDLIKYPMLKDAPIHKVVLGAGDLLFIPRHWVHQVRSFESPNIGMSMWFLLFPTSADIDFTDTYAMEDDYAKSLNEAPDTIECKSQNMPMQGFRNFNFSLDNRPKATTPPPYRIDPDLVNNTILHREIDDKTAAIFGGSDDRHIYAIDARKGELLWKVETKMDTGSGCVFSLDGDIVFCGADDGYMRKIRVRDGIVIDTFKVEGSIISTPVLDKEGTLYFASLDQYTYALKTKNFDLKWMKRVRGKVWSSLVISRDQQMVFVSTVHERRTNVFSLNTEDGSVVWKMNGRAGFMASPELSHDGRYLYLCDMERYLYQVDTNTGDQKQLFHISEEANPEKKTPGKGIKSSPKVSDRGVVYVAVESGRFIALDMMKGVLKWDFNLGDSLRGTSSSPLIGPDGRVYIGSGDGMVYAFNGDTGKMLWNKKLGSEIFFSSPRLAVDGSLFIGTVDGPVYALDSKTGAIKWSYKTDGPFVGTVLISESFAWKK